MEDCQDGSDEKRDQCDSPLGVRLIGGNNVTSGRLEIRHNGVWGSVCDDEFGAEEGGVVCKMLGLPGGVKIHTEVKSWSIREESLNVCATFDSHSIICLPFYVFI